MPDDASPIDMAPLTDALAAPSRRRRAAGDLPELPTRTYEALKLQLQAELLKVQIWTQETGQKFVVLFEGRDAAGKGGTIKRYMEHLNPRYARVVALTKPSDKEKGSGSFSAISRTCRRRAKWCSMIGPGTTARAWSG